MIDAGDSDAVPAGVTTDIDENPRFLDDPGTPDNELVCGGGALAWNGNRNLKREAWSRIRSRIQT